MRFHWLVDQVEQGLFKVYWVPGNIKLANYYSKKKKSSITSQKYETDMHLHKRKKPMYYTRVFLDSHSRTAHSAGVLESYTRVIGC